MDTKMTPAANAIQEKMKNNKILRDAHREMGKFCLDCTRVTLSVRRGTLSLFGKLAPLMGQETIFEDERSTRITAIRASAVVTRSSRSDSRTIASIDQPPSPAPAS